MRLSRNTRNLNLVRLLGIVLLAGLVGLRIADPEPLKNIRNDIFDAYQQLKPREHVPQPVTIVDIDEQSLREIGQWPWPRSKIGQLIDTLTQMQAITIAFDIVFAEEDRLSPEQIAKDNETLPPDIASGLAKLPTNDSVMASAMRRGRVIVGQTSVREHKDASGADREIIDAPHAKLGLDPTPFMESFPELVENQPELEEAAVGRGVFSISQDPDGIIRRIPLVSLVSGKVRAGLGFEALRIATGGDSFSIKTSEAGIEGIIASGRIVRTDENGKVWPYFARPDSSRYISAAAILNQTADSSRITNHIILVGSSAVGLEDYRPIPLGTRVPGVEVHGQLLENILTDTLLFRSPRALLYEILAAVTFSLVIILIVYRTSAAVAAIATIALGGCVIVASWWAFSNHRLLFDVSWPVSTLFCVSLLGGIANYIREEQQRQQIQGAFGQYLSPAVVNQLRDNPEQLVLGGESRELSVLFTDVRGFTTISESYSNDPQGLTSLMNDFLTVLSDPILERNGTIDKYMGDAIMAFWNAPLDDNDHAENACRSALVMMAEVKKLNDRRRAEWNRAQVDAFHEINVGVGINTGLCVVGNMGSANRFDYTALGDTVNLASRLEGQSKTYGLDIVLGEATASEVQSSLATFEIDLIRVKGKEEPARVYCLAGDEKMAGTDDFLAFRALNKTMISSYRTQNWEQAFEALEKMEELGEKLELPLRDYVFIYETRISEFRANPPGKNWDGVYTALSK